MQVVVVAEQADNRILQRMNTVTLQHRYTKRSLDLPLRRSICLARNHKLSCCCGALQQSTILIGQRLARVDNDEGEIGGFARPRRARDAFLLDALSAIPDARRVDPS